MLFCFYVFNDYLCGWFWLFSKLYCFMCSKGFFLCKLWGKIKLLFVNILVRYFVSFCFVLFFDRSMLKWLKR